jgi:sugar phosphate isomerase/epimerase
MRSDSLSRRAFLAVTAAGSLASAATPDKNIPVGLELYSVRDDLKKDLMNTVRAVAKMGYSCVEFYAPYYEWTPDYARQVRKLLDDLGIRCYSTHNDAQTFTAAKLPRAIDLNHTLGSQFIVMAHPGDVHGLDGYKKVADTLNEAAATLKPAGLRAGYHNHEAEFKAIGGRRPMEVLAAHTGKDVMLQLDVGTCLEAGADPVAWVDENPGRICSMHLKDWSPAKGYRVLFGEGVAPWKKLFQVAEHTGGIEYYLIEQEGSDYPELETVQRCLVNFHKLHA